MEEGDTGGITAVFAADPQGQARTGLSTRLACEAYQGPHPLNVQGLEWVGVQYFFFDVLGQV